MRRAPGSAVALAAAAIAAGSLAGAAEPKTGPGGSIGPGNVKAFATEFDRTFGAALKPLFGRLASIQPAGGGQKRDVSLTLKGKTGNMRVAGYGLVLPSPARWDLTLTFGNFSAAVKKGRPLGLGGALQFNFVTPRVGRATLPVGLFRGFLTLSGRFAGTADVYGEVESGKVVSLVVTSKGKTLRVGGAPRELVSYVSTVAGSGKWGFADGLGRAAKFNRPQGVAVSPDGRVFVADTDNNAIRAISPTGAVTTLVRDLRQPTDVGLDGSTLIASANSEDAPLSRIDTATGALTPLIGPVGKIEFGFFAGLPLCNDTCDGFTPLASLPHPNGIDVQGGVIFIAQNEDPPTLRFATRAGSIHTLRDLRGACGSIGVGGPADVTKGLNGDLYWVADVVGCYSVMVMHSDGTFGVIAGDPHTEGRVDGKAGKARFFNLTGLVFDGTRYLYVADDGNSWVRRVDVLDGTTIRVAGCPCTNYAGFKDGPGDVATFQHPRNLALNAWGDLYVADEYNGAVRLVRIITDPQRDPQIRRFEPYALLRGSSARITVSGENLGLTQSASLGAGVDVKVVSQSSRTLQLDVAISATAPVGTHTLSVKTFYGKADTPPGLSLQVLDQNEAQVTVETIAGTGSWTPGVHDGPAIKQQFGFPAGSAALDSGRLIVADPLEQRLRFVGSKDGTERELVDLLLNNSGSSAALGAALAPLGALGQLLGSLGASSLVGKATSSLLMPIVKAAVDQYCASIGDPCTWIEMPWAGSIAPGETEGFRMSARMFLPVDVAKTTDSSVVFAADTGNGRTATIGLDPRKDPAQKSPTNLFSTNSVGGRPFGVADAGSNAMYISVPERNGVWRMDLKNKGVKAAFAGNDNQPGCEQKSGDAKHPLGIPMGMDATKDNLFVADPFCGTIWKIATKDGSTKDMRGPLASLGAGSGACSDGPVAFATFGAPVDVAVDNSGTIWVADAGCNSIREIKDVWASKETSAISGALKGMLGGLAGRLPSSTVGKIQSAIDSAQPDFIEANRWWVITVAGSREGVGGFRDGLAGQTLFSGPMGVTTAPGDRRVHLCLRV